MAAHAERLAFVCRNAHIAQKHLKGREGLLQQP